MNYSIDQIKKHEFGWKIKLKHITLKKFKPQFTVIVNFGLKNNYKKNPTLHNKPYTCV